MRELTKSVMRFSWAMPLLGMKQMANIVLPRDLSRSLEPATETFNTMSDAASQQLGSRLQEVFETGDRFQRSVVDLMFSLLDRRGGEPARQTDEPDHH